MVREIGIPPKGSHFGIKSLEKLGKSSAVVSKLIGDLFGMRY